MHKHFLTLLENVKEDILKIYILSFIEFKCRISQNYMNFPSGKAIRIIIFKKSPVYMNHEIFKSKNLDRYYQNRDKNGIYL